MKNIELYENFPHEKKIELTSRGGRKINLIGRENNFYREQFRSKFPVFSRPTIY